MDLDWRKQFLDDFICRQQALGGLSPLSGTSVGLARAETPSRESGAPGSNSKAKPAAKSSRRKRRSTTDKLAADADIVTSKEPKRAFTVDEAVKVYSISRSSIYVLIKSGTLPDVTVGGRRLLPRDAMEALIAGKRS